ncbi:MAG: sensor histidine kinase [Myxococcales bacterium]|nr:sensor histidine kinase [Myxococcales bacterium]
MSWSDPIARALRRGLLPVRPLPDQGVEAEAAFDAFAVNLTVNYAITASALMLVFTLAWWPLDLWVLRAGPERDAFATMRQHVVVIELVGLLGFWRWPWMRARALWMGPLLYTALLGAIGHALGRAGPGALTWLSDGFIGVVPMAFVPLRLPARVVATACIGAALVGGFFLPYPANLAAPMALGQVSFAVFAVVFSVGIGEVLRRVLHTSFMQQRQLDAANGDLSALSASLAQRVDEKTQAIQALAQHLEQALEAQRRRIARDLHDDLGQALTAVRYTLARLQGRLPEASEPVQELLEDLGSLVDGTSASIRGFLSELRPRVLDDYGLVAAAEWQLNRVRELSGLAVALTVDPAFPGAPDADGLPGEGRLDPETALALFRVLQEATTNALKHAQATALRVTLSVDGGRFCVTVEDDGVGFDAQAPAAGFGLLGLRERLRARDGIIEIDGAGGGRIHACLAGRVIDPVEGE